MGLYPLGLYPLVFEPVIKTMVWGSESWSLTCREKEMSVVLNGGFRGERFIDVINRDRAAWLGKKGQNAETFPLLVKIIDARDDLSIQVHPADDYARAVEGDPYGKTEMWYILDAPENGALVIGVKDGVTRGEFERALDGGGKEAEKLFNRLPIKRGDLINIPAGLIHAITGGVKLAEIQQNSDRTYRVYDYDRLGLDGKPRELHVRKALDVADFDGKIPKTLHTGGDIKNDWFAVKKIGVDGRAEMFMDGETFLLLTCVDGSVVLSGGFESVGLKEGDTAFLPAALGEFTAEGRGVLLHTLCE